MSERKFLDGFYWGTAYAEELRQENGKYRQRAQKADQHVQRLDTELVRATGKLADPEDMPFDETHLDDPAARNAAIDDLVNPKPHFASRRPTAEIGQGATRHRLPSTSPRYCDNAPDKERRR